MTTTRSNRSRQPRQLNAAFAAAHGLSVSSEKDKATEGAQIGQSSSKRLQHAVESARKSGKLNVANIGLSSPLPDVLFDLRSGMQVNLSMDSSSPSSWELHAEDTLTLVDYCDNNGIGVLDDRIQNYRSLAVFRLKRCNLTSLPWKSLASLEQLTILDLESNGLTAFSIELLPKSIRDLTLSSNKLRTLVASVDGEKVELPNLVKLDVSHNCLEDIPSGLFCPKMQSFACGHNQISEIPASFLESAAQSLTTLEGRRNRITVSPDFINCSQLSIVDLSENRLTKAPVVNLSLLRLTLSDNLITSLKGLFGDGESLEQSQLVELHIRDNRLVELDGAIVQRLVHLKLLDVSNNNLSGLPSVLGYLPQVRQVLLDGNPLRTIGSADRGNSRALQSLLRKRGPAPAGEGYLAQECDATHTFVRGETCKESSRGTAVPTNSILTALVGSNTLKLEARQLTEIPPAMLEQLRNSNNVAARIQHLKLGQNVLEHIDGELLSILSNLTALEADKNRLTQLPISLGSLSLATLSLSQNLLTSESITASSLGNSQRASITNTLTQLDLSCNRLEWFPSSLLELRSLRILVISNNRISSLAVASSGASGWKPGLPSLEHLDFSDNCIQNLGDLPLAVGATCPMLKTLLLQNNDLKSIPPTIGLLDDLQHLDVRGNPQRAVRSSILDKGCAATLLYLRNRLTPQELQDFQAKRNKISQNLMSETTVETDEKEECQKMQAPGADALSSSLAHEIREEIDSLTLQLNNVHLSQAKKYAMKKSLAIQKAKLIREERRLQQENS